MRILIAAGLSVLPATAMAASGMPQLDFSTPLTLTQAVWLLVIFAGLYLVLARIALPPVAQVLQRRADIIRTDLDAAKGASDAAKAARLEREKAEAKARAEAQAAMRGAIDRAKQQNAEALAKIESRLASELREAEARIAAVRASAMAGITAVAADAAAAAVQRVAGFTPDRAVVQAAVAETLAARR